MVHIQSLSIRIALVFWAGSMFWGLFQVPWPTTSPSAIVFLVFLAVIVETPLDTTVGSTRVTGIYFRHQSKLNSGNYPVLLYSREKDKTANIGMIEISN